MPSRINLWHICKTNHQIRIRMGPFVSEYSKVATDNKISSKDNWPCSLTDSGYKIACYSQEGNSFTILILTWLSSRLILVWVQHFWRAALNITLIGFMLGWMAIYRKTT